MTFPVPWDTLRLSEGVSISIHPLQQSRSRLWCIQSPWAPPARFAQTRMISSDSSSNIPMCGHYQAVASGHHSHPAGYFQHSWAAQLMNTQQWCNFLLVGLPPLPSCLTGSFSVQPSVSQTWLRLVLIRYLWVLPPAILAQQSGRS